MQANVAQAGLENSNGQEINKSDRDRMGDLQDRVDEWHIVNASEEKIIRDVESRREIALQSGGRDIDREFAVEQREGIVQMVVSHVPG